MRSRCRGGPFSIFCFSTRLKGIPMNKFPTKTFGLLLAIVMVSAWCGGQEKAKNDHASMKKEHLQASNDHDRWQSEIAKWIVEHRRALAALAQLQARILEHDAELQELAEHARQHERHIRDHDSEIHDHEKGGSAADHEKLATKHKELMLDHKQMEKEITSHSDSHQELMKGIADLLKLVERKEPADRRPADKKR
jgi:hypothetical protein